MKRLRGTVLFGFVIVVLYYVYSQFYDMTNIYNCFKRTGAEFIRMDIEGSAKIKTEESLADTAVSLFKLSGIPGEYSLKEAAGTAGASEAVELTSSNNYLAINIKVKKLPDENLLYASFMLSQYSGNMNITNTRRTISNAFLNYGEKPSFSSLIQGKYEEHLTIPQMKEKASRIFISSRAAFVNSIDDGNIVSVSGFIPGIEDETSYMGKSVNLNIALRYIGISGCTYIWIGSPIILTEY